MTEEQLSPIRNGILSTVQWSQRTFLVTYCGIGSLCKLQLQELLLQEPIRLEVLMTGVGTDLAGGPLSIMHLMIGVLRRTDIEVR